MDSEVKKIYNTLKGHRFLISNEKALQLDIESLFKKNDMPYKREYHLDESDENIIDFLMDGGLGIEVKIKANKRAIYEQLLRYSLSADITRLILVTGTNTGMPKELSGKPIYILNISKAWL